MNQNLQNSEQVNQLLGLSPEKLSKAIFDANNPELFVLSLPPQTAYMALQASDDEVRKDIIDILSERQYRSALDFEFWRGDDFNQKAFWHWLEVIDEKQDLTPLHTFLQRVDQRLLVALIVQYIDVVINEEPTEASPGPTFYTPDKGHTWIQIKLTDPEQHRLFGKLLAFIFQSDVTRFYQLISLPAVVTSSEVIEEAYQDKIRRLYDEGVPPSDVAARIHSAKRWDVKDGDARTQTTVEYGASALPLRYQGSRLEPLSSFVQRVSSSEALAQRFSGELALVTNAAIVHFGADFSDHTGVTLLVDKIRGAINIGIEVTSKDWDGDIVDLYEQIGIEAIYRAGLFELQELRRKAEGVTYSHVDSLDEKQNAICEALVERFPGVPTFFYNESDRTELDTTILSINSLKEISAIEKYLAELSSTNKEPIS